jgi:hypothetical protein
MGASRLSSNGVAAPIIANIVVDYKAVTTQPQ